MTRTSSSPKWPKALSRGSPRQSAPVSDSTPLSVPLVDLRSQYRAIEGEIQAAVNAVFSTQQFILGDAVRNFEQQMTVWLRTNSAAGVASGSDALLLALTAIGIGPGDAVLVPPFTFFST